jgi:hypothetical protein
MGVYICAIGGVDDLLCAIYHAHIQMYHAHIQMYHAHIQIYHAYIQIHHAYIQMYHAHILKKACAGDFSEQLYHTYFIFFYTCVVGIFTKC